MDLTSKAVTEVLTRTIEYLQPNPGECPDLSCLLPSAPEFARKETEGAERVRENLFGPEILVTSPRSRSGDAGEDPDTPLPLCCVPGLQDAAVAVEQ